VLRKKSVAGYLIFLAAVTMAAQVEAPATKLSTRPELQTIIQRMEQAARGNRDRYKAYIITREYRMYGGNQQKPGSKVVADISFIPPKTKEFTITKAEGSPRGENVVRHILENEQKATETGQAPGAVVSDNYEFTLAGEESLDGHPCYVLGLSPKRKDKSLLIGRAWIDEQTFLVRRVQGDMAKMPSWWIKSVQVTLDFNEVQGMWMQTSTVAHADVRVFGPHTLQENAVKVRTGSMVAELNKANKPARRTFRNAEAVLGSFEH